MQVIQEDKIFTRIHTLKFPNKLSKETFRENLIKRVDEFATYKPGFEEGKSVRLYPLDRFEDSRSKVSPAQLAFNREGNSLFSFELFIGIGFIVASFLYRRSLSTLEEVGEIDS